MREAWEDFLRIRSAEFISALLAGYWLALSLLDQRIGGKLQSYRALTDVAPHYWWALIFTVVCLAQPVLAHSGAPGRRTFRLATALLWLGIGILQARKTGLVGPAVYLLWAIGLETLRRAIADSFGIIP